MTELLTADMARMKNDEINKLNKEKIEEICGSLIDKINHLISAYVEENQHSLIYKVGYSNNTNLVIRALELLRQKLNDAGYQEVNVEWSQNKSFNHSQTEVVISFKW